MRTPIVCIIGKSGAGKSTLVQYLLGRIPNTAFLKLYTTRPPRSEEEKEHSFEYCFVNFREYKDLKRQSNSWEELIAGQYYYGVNVDFINRQRNEGIIFLATMLLERGPLERRQCIHGGILYVYLQASEELMAKRGIELSRKNRCPVDDISDLVSLTLVQTGDLDRDLQEAHLRILQCL